MKFFFNYVLGKNIAYFHLDMFTKATMIFQIILYFFQPFVSSSIYLVIHNIKKKDFVLTL